MKYGRLFLAVIGVLLIVAGCIAALTMSPGVGLALVMIGLVAVVLAISDWHEFEPQAYKLKLRVTRASQPAPEGPAGEQRLPEIRIVELKPTGAGTFLDFTALVQNVGTKPARMTPHAHVGDRDVIAEAESLDLLVNAPPVRVFIRVLRPDLGELMPECDDATTLYGETLHFRVDADGEYAEESWREELYDSGTDRERYEIQQRYWRRGRGEETSNDLRAEALRRHEERIESGEPEDARYRDV